MNRPHASRVILGCSNFNLAILFKIALVACDGDDNIVANLQRTELTRLMVCSVSLHAASPFFATL